MTIDSDPYAALATAALHAGTAPDPTTGAILTPIYQSTTFVQEAVGVHKGYTYSPHSAIEHSVAGSILTLQTDVATEVTAPALLEILYELGKVALLPLDEDELAAAKRYAAGTLALSTLPLLTSSRWSTPTGERRAIL